MPIAGTRTLSHMSRIVVVELFPALDTGMKHWFQLTHQAPPGPEMIDTKQ